MSFLNNLKLSKEDELIEMEMENSEPIEEVSVAESVQDDVDNSSDSEEFQETMVAAEEDLVEMEKQEEVLEGLQEQDAAIEEKLETPEEVTPEDVVVAQEALAFSIGRLASGNMDYKEFKKQIRISYENNNNEPVAILRQIHTEGVKEFIAKVIESIKILFTRIVNWIKKLMVKIVLLFDQSEKTLNKIEAVIDKYGMANINEARWKNVADRKLSAAMHVCKMTKVNQSLAKALDLCLELKDMKKTLQTVQKLVLIREVDGGANNDIVKIALTAITSLMLMEEQNDDTGYISFTGQTATKAEFNTESEHLPFKYAVSTETIKQCEKIMEFDNLKYFRDAKPIVATLKAQVKRVGSFIKEVETNSKSFHDFIKSSRSDISMFKLDIIGKICKLAISHVTLGAIKSYVGTVRGGVAVLAGAITEVNTGNEINPD